LPSGIITRITLHGRNLDRVTVYLDEGFSFEVYQDLVSAFELRVGQALTEADLARIQEEEAFLNARAKAIAFIAYRARTEHEVRTRLAQDGFSEGVREQVVERLYQLGLLDDEAYTLNFVRERFQRRGYGPSRLRRDLLRRGVDRLLIDKALKEILSPPDVLEAAREQAEKRWFRLAGEFDLQKRRKKLGDFLLRHGFNYDVVIQVVEEMVRGERR
jgi:regulatory protein